MMSKNITQITYASTNAVTILNAAQLNLCKQTWNGIRIPEANLCSAMLSGTDLRGADLTGVNFTSAFLKNCNMEKAMMRNV